MERVMKFETVKFGPFEWLVLERKGNTALLITEGIIERGPYHAKKEGTTWEKSAVRGFLNGKFLDKFDPKDRAKIIEVTNQNPDNPWYKTKSAIISIPGVTAHDSKGGNPTKDKIFLLSIEEVCRYFGDSTARLKDKGFTQLGGGKTQLGPGMKLSDLSIITDKNDSKRTAIMPGSFSKEKDKSDKAFWWWLRSPGEADALAAYISDKGSINITGKTIFAVKETQMGGVRPAVWVNL
jgi:hypothetical protein